MFADDMEIAPDFFEYFEATAKLLEDDKFDRHFYSMIISSSMIHWKFI
jgi:hypothetical protein